MQPPIITVISVLPFKSFNICFPRNKPAKEIANVITQIMETCSQIVALFDNPACKETPTAIASMTVATPMSDILPPLKEVGASCSMTLTSQA